MADLPMVGARYSECSGLCKTMFVRIYIVSISSTLIIVLGLGSAGIAGRCNSSLNVFCQ